MMWHEGYARLDSFCRCQLGVTGLEFMRCYAIRRVDQMWPDTWYVRQAIHLLPEDAVPARTIVPAQLIQRDRLRAVGRTLDAALLCLEQAERASVSVDDASLSADIAGYAQAVLGLRDRVVERAARGWPAQARPGEG